MLVCKVFSLFLILVLSLSTVVFGEVEDEELTFLGSEKYESSLEDLAGRKLYVYGLLDSISEEKIDLDVESYISRLEVTDLLYKLCKSNEKDEIVVKDSMFIDVPDEYQEAVNYLFSRNIVGGISEIEFGDNTCSIDSFCCMLLRYLGEDIEYDKSLKRVKELGLLKYTTLENGFTKGDVYIILSNLIELEYNGKKIKDNMVFENKREEVRIPKEIDIYVTSYFDFLEKFEVAYFFAPYNVNITFLEECPEIDRYLIYDLLLKDDYSWKGLFDDFYAVNKVNSYRGMGWTIVFSDVLDKHWMLSDDERALKAVEICDDIETIYENGGFSEYGEMSEKYSYYLEDIVRFTLTADKQDITIRTGHFNDSVYLNIDTLDWVRCYNKSEFTQSIIACLNDMAVYKNLSDYEKINKVHDYICRKASYDYNEYRDLIGGGDGYKYIDAHEVMGFLIDGDIVCDGYAYTYQWLLDYLGVESIVVYGTSTINGKKEGHAWNKVKLDGEWYNVDVCWADTGEGKQYFLKSDDYFKGHYHIFEEDFLLPSLKAEKDYSM